MGQGEAHLTSLVPDAGNWPSTLQLLHSLVTLDTTYVNDARDEDVTSAMPRVARELDRGFPGFAIRSLSWDEVRARYPGDQDMTEHDLIRLVADLQDAHTSLRRRTRVFHPPYAVTLPMHGPATFVRVPAWSHAAAAGVTAGWTLEIEQPERVVETVGAPRHAHALLSGRRAIALAGVDQREFTAVSPDGARRAWTEHAAPFTDDQLLESSTMSAGGLYLRLHNWIEGRDLDERLDALLQEHRMEPALVLDLRGNTGGSLVMAQRWRKKFLRRRTLLGTIRYTRGDGSMSDHLELWDEPDGTVSWRGHLTVLTDPLTYSASEDFLHGLQGLDHVTVLGQPTGGGSGRPRTLPVTHDWDLSISTALTYDRTGRCIEGNGIPVDGSASPAETESTSPARLATSAPKALRGVRGEYLTAPPQHERGSAAPATVRHP